MTTKTKHWSQKMKRSLKAGFWPRLRFTTTISIFVLIGSTLWSGTACSVSAGPIEVACPLGVVQVLAAARSFVPALLLAGLLGVLIVVFLGRAFCSWVCPGRWIFNHGPAQTAKPWRQRVWVQRALMGVVVGAAWICRTPVFCTICPAGIFCRGAIAAGSGGSLLPTLGWLGALVGVEWASGRSWCRDLCPLGAAVSRLSRLNPFFIVKADHERCLPCKACQQACPEDLNLASDIDLSSCTKCFECQGACPREAVDIKLVKI